MQTAQTPSTLEKTSLELLELVLVAGLGLTLLVPNGCAIAPAALVLAGSLVLLRGRWIPSKAGNPTLLVVGCFMIYAAGSALISFAHRDPIGHFEQYVPFLLAGLAAIGLAACSPRAGRILIGFALGALVAGVVAIFQILTAPGICRVHLFMNETTFGAITALYTVVCASALGWADRTYGIRLRILLVAGVLGGLAAALLNGSKGSWLALALVGPFVFLQATPDMTLWRRIGWAAGLAVYLAGLSCLPNSPVISRSEDFVRHGDHFRESYWQIGCSMIKENPWTGNGRAEVNLRLMRTETSEMPARSWRHLHNDYIDLLAARGIGGLTLFLVALGAPLAAFFQLWKSSDKSLRGPETTGILFVITFALLGLTDVLFIISARRLVFLTGVLILLYLASRRPGEERPA